jgi:hypothetical protein
MGDRAVQDEVIRYLADAKVRAQKPHGPICAGEAAKASQFAHFLARRYYRDRLARSFRYSHRFRRQTGRIAEEVADLEEFDRFLSQCVMGSLKSAQQVGGMARARLYAVLEPGPWWHDLLDYEYAYFLQVATAGRGVTTDRPSRGASVVCRRFAWAMPEMLPLLRAGEAIGGDLRRESALLFSRTHTGRIFVVQVDAIVESIFHATDGASTVDEIAAAVGVSIEQARGTLQTLSGIGAVIIPADAF